MRWPTSLFDRSMLRMLAYAVSVGLQRGAPIVFLPMFFVLMSVAEYGRFATSYAVAMLLAPVLSINAQAAILREGVHNERDGRFLLAVSSAALIALASVLGLLMMLAFAFWAVAGEQRAMIGWIVALGAAEGIFLNVLAQLRATDSAFSYLAAVSLRLAALLVVLLVTSNFMQTKISSHEVLLAHAASSAAIVLPILLLVLAQRPLSDLFVRDGDRMLVQTSLNYCAPLLPHSSAQWLFNAIGRIAVMFWLGAETAGYFNAAFTLGSIFSLAPAVFGLIIPPMLIADYERWRDTDISHRFFLGLALFSTVALALLLGLVLLDTRLNITGIAYKPWSVLVIATIAACYVSMTSYNLFGSVFFYLRDTGRLALITLVVVAVAAVFQFLAARTGVIGATAAFAASQWGYVLVIAREVERKDPAWRPRVRHLFRLFAVCCCAMIALGAGAYSWSI